MSQSRGGGGTSSTTKIRSVGKTREGRPINVQNTFEQTINTIIYDFQTLYPNFFKLRPTMLMSNKSIQ